MVNIYLARAPVLDTLKALRSHFLFWSIPIVSEQTELHGKSVGPPHPPLGMSRLQANVALGVFSLKLLST